MANLDPKLNFSDIIHYSWIANMQQSYTGWRFGLSGITPNHVLISYLDNNTVLGLIWGGLNWETAENELVTLTPYYGPMGSGLVNVDLFFGIPINA